MADCFSPLERSAIMRAVASQDTTPEWTVRRLVHRLGFRYRLHDARLPGRPDLVFRARRKVIFVHGCFWHQHSCARGNRQPKSHAGYWRPKLARNQARDRRHRRRLRALGWRVLVVWECQMRDPVRLADRLQKFLADSPREVTSRN